MKNSRGLLLLVMAASASSIAPREVSAQEVAGARIERARLGVGGLLARRYLVMSADEPAFDAHLPGAYAGGQAQLLLDLAQVTDSGVRLQLVADGAYAAGKDSSVTDELGRPLATELMTGRLLPTLLRPLSEKTSLAIGLGLSATSITNEPNSVYTGHRYLAADIAVGLRREIASGRGRAVLELDVLPVFRTDESGGADGELSSFGARGRAEVVYLLVQKPARIELGLSYTYSRFGTQYPEATRFGARGASSVDEMQLVALSAYYSL